MNKENKSDKPWKFFIGYIFAGILFYGAMIIVIITPWANPEAVSGGLKTQIILSFIGVFFIFASIPKLIRTIKYYRRKKK